MDGFDLQGRHNISFYQNTNQSDHNHPLHTKQNDFDCTAAMQSEYPNTNKINRHEISNEQKQIAYITNSSIENYTNRTDTYDHDATSALQNKMQYLQSSNDYTLEQNRTEMTNQSTISEKCELENNQLTDDDAFIAFCADTSSVLNNDPNRRYHINKLYQPLEGDVHNQQSADVEGQSIEQDDEYLLYQELRFIESSARELCSDSERSVLTKILDEEENNYLIDDNQDDSLENLQLTKIIESVESFTASPLIDNERDPLMCGIYPQKSASPVIPDSSQQGGQFTLTNYQSSDRTLCMTNNESFSKYDQEDMIVQSTRTEGYIPVQSNHRESFIYQQNNQVHAETQLFNQTNQTSTQNQISEAEATDIHQISSTLDIPSIDTHPPQLAQAGSSNIGNHRERVNEETVRPTSRLESSDLALIASSMSKKRQALCSSEDHKSNYIPISNKKRRKFTEYDSNCVADDDNDLGFSDNNSIKSDLSRQNPITNRYRRRTANARERIRMREINQAFEKLKKVVPVELVRQASEAEQTNDRANQEGRKSRVASNNTIQSSDSPKLTKITTLRLAVDYISKLSSLLNDSPCSTSDSQTKSKDQNDRRKKRTRVQHDDSVQKSKRTQRTTMKKQNLKISARSNSKLSTIQQENTSQSISDNTFISNESNTENKQKFEPNVATYIRPQQPIFLTNNSISGTGIDQIRQTAFITLPNANRQPLKQQYLTTYPNQQQLLISQQFGSGSDRAMVTPVTLAILGIPASTNNQTTLINQNLNSHSGIQVLGLQNHQLRTDQHQTAQQQPTYNLQLTQQHLQSQSRQSSHLTLTLNDVSGLPYIRLTNPAQNQSIAAQPIPVQIKTNSPQIVQGQSHTKVLTSPAQMNYTYHPVQSSRINQSHSSEKQISTNGHQANIRISNNLNDSAISPNNINNNSFIAGDLHHVPAHQTIFSVAQSDCIPSITAPATITGKFSDQSTKFDISSSNNTDLTSQKCNRTLYFEPNQASRIPVAIRQHHSIQQSMSPASNNLVAITTSSADKLIHNQATIQIGTNKTANLVYINPIQSNSIAFKQTGEQIERHYSSKIEGICDITKTEDIKSAFVQTKFVSQVGAQPIDRYQKQSEPQGQNQAIVSNEKDINQLVACIATSIQPSNNTTDGSTQDSEAISDQQTGLGKDNLAYQQVQQRQQLQQQRQQNRQPVRTYRFHNYDGNMITNNLYGNNNNVSQNERHQIQQITRKTQLTTGKSSECSELSKSIEQQQHPQQQQQPVSNQRSRQNSLSSVCSTTSSSSSLLNSASSSNGSPVSDQSSMVSMMVNSSSLQSSLNTDVQQSLVSSSKTPSPSIVATKSKISSVGSNLVAAK